MFDLDTIKRRNEDQCIKAYKAECETKGHTYSVGLCVRALEGEQVARSLILADMDFEGVGTERVAA